MRHWKFGQEVSYERRVDGRFPKRHVALSLAACRNDRIHNSPRPLRVLALVGRVDLGRQRRSIGQRQYRQLGRQANFEKRLDNAGFHKG